jgi:hypothetical protein
MPRTSLPALTPAPAPAPARPRAVLDGPFAETGELTLGYWPARAVTR